MAQHQGGCLARIEMTAKQPPADERRKHRDQRNQPSSEEGGKLCGHEIGRPIRKLYEEFEATTRLLRRNLPDCDKGKQQGDRQIEPPQGRNEYASNAET
jgi:hypothetical protein